MCQGSPARQVWTGSIYSKGPKSRKGGRIWKCNTFEDICALYAEKAMQKECMDETGLNSGCFNIEEDLVYILESAN